MLCWGVNAAGFNISLEPGFSVTRLCWMLAYGGVYAVANLRYVASLPEASNHRYLCTLGARSMCKTWRTGQRKMAGRKCQSLIALYVRSQEILVMREDGVFQQDPQVSGALLA